MGMDYSSRTGAATIDWTISPPPIATNPFILLGFELAKPRQNRRRFESMKERRGFFILPNSVT